MLDRHKKYIWFWLSVFIVLLDQLSKYTIIRSFFLYETHTIFPFFNLTLAYNAGAAFRFLDNSAELAFWLFSSIATLFSIIITIWLCRLPAQKTHLGFALSLILGGAIGNLIDRILHRHVIDFLQFHYNTWYFPTFNIADTAISIGAAILFLNICFNYKSRAF